MSIRDRFQRAARDGFLDILKDATRKDCNLPDDDGMTPTLWAAYSGNLDALRAIVGRGGDPGKCDNHGNTALHCAASNGHINCVSFLVSFGVNLWSLDNDFHTAKDLAAINNRDDVMKFLDHVIAKQSAINTKTVQKMKEKAIIDAEKRVKAFQKLQKKAAKKAEKEDKLMEKRRKKLTELNNDNQQNHIHSYSGETLNRDSNNQTSLKFSDIVNSKNSSTASSKIKVLSGVSKKVQLRKQSDSISSSNDFKIREILNDDGTQSVRSLMGIRRDNEILYVPKFESLNKNRNDNDMMNSPNGRLHMKDVFGSDEINGTNGNEKHGNLYRALSEPEFLYQSYSPTLIPDGSASPPESSIFVRPGFGSVSFRGRITSESIIPMIYNDETNNRESDKSTISHGDSIGSAGSLAQRNVLQQHWDEDEEIQSQPSKSFPIYLFLYSKGLTEYAPIFCKEKIDLDALMLLTDDDLKSLGLPLGPRKKLLNAVAGRCNAIDNPGHFRDTKL